ncbi:MAG: MarR family transcriptional regulator, partial [Chryseobacterium sp.]
ENNISRIIVLLNRHVRNYTKKVFDDTPLQTLEEFSYLTMLYNVSSLTKSELINLNFQEKTSGTEVIKRLLAYGLAVQFDDQLDKRSQRVKITDSGKELIDSIAKDISSVSESLVSILPNKERERLLAVLQKLDVYHSTEFSKNKVVKYRNAKPAS